MLFITQDKPGEGKLHCEFTNEDNGAVDFEILSQNESIQEIHRLNQRIAQMMCSSLFFPSFRRIEGGFAKVPRYADSNNYARRRWIGFEDKATEPLQEALARISTEVSVYNHKFIASISTYDIVKLLTEKYADVSSKTNELHAKLSEDITEQTSAWKPLQDTAATLKGIQKRVEEINEERESLFRPFLVLGERIRDIFHYEGISVTTGITFGETKEAIESDRLSAGEKQMLSFLCYNAFSENTAIFIDEPELSLHVDWQRLLLPTLLEQETGNQFFVATHSPFIYTQYPEREILLDEDRGGE